MKTGRAFDVHSWRFTLLVHLVFVVVYVAIVSTRYGSIFRMMEANSGVDSWFLHLFRWPVVGALIYGTGFALLSLGACLRYRLRPYTIIGSCVLAWFFVPHVQTDEGGYHLFSEKMNQEAQVCNYVLLADDKKWDELLQALRDDENMDTPLGMRYALLAESALGRLPDALFRYPVRSADDLLFRGDRSPLCCQFNRQFYENLGVYDEAFHQAMEYGVKQKGGCCLSTLRHLTDYALAEGDWKVADKYLAVLDEAWLQGDFVKERRAKMKEVKASQQLPDGNPKLGSDPDLGFDKPLRGEAFVGLYPLRSEMVRLAYYQEADQQKAVDYLLCINLIEKRLDTFYSVLTQFPNYMERDLPSAYEQALEILQSEGQALRDAPPGTYAYYFYHVEPS